MADPTMNSKDVEMKETEEQKKEEADEQQQSKKDKDPITFLDVRELMWQVERSVSDKEPRFMFRAVRSLHVLRKRINNNVLRAIISAYYPQSSAKVRDALLQYLDEPMETEYQFRPRSKTATSVVLPELDILLHLMVVQYLLDKGPDLLEKARECSDALMQKLETHNRRTMDVLGAKCYFYHSRAHELLGRLADIRSFLHFRLRTATLCHDENGQAMILNLLLRNYLHYNLYDQAGKLVSKSSFPESAGNSEMAKYFYYLGRIKAIHLDYTEAYQHLVQAIRKAPQHSAVGFKQISNKFAIVVQLLLGEIPDRATFREPILRKPLVPYFQLTQAVRNGDLGLFSEVLENYGKQFQLEHTYTLIIRLRHNVIKTAVRMISLSYSRISLVNVAEKLRLDSVEDVEYIVAKAIKDGVIEASIDHEMGSMQSKENSDIYFTKEPQEAFHQRILFSLDLYTQSVKAMRYPPKAYKKDLETAEKRREREQQDMELAKEMAEEEDEDFS